MDERISTRTRSLFYFNDMKTNVPMAGNTWAYIYALVLLLGSTLIGVFIYQMNLYIKEKKFDEVNARVWYIVVNIIFAFLIYGITRRSISRTIVPLFSREDSNADPYKNLGTTVMWVLFVLLPLSPAFVFIEVWDKIYLAFRAIFKGDQEEFDQEVLDDINSKLSSKLKFLKTVDLDRSERFTYLFGNLSYDRQDSTSIFRDGTDIVRTPVLICSFFVALCMLIPVAITAANGQSLEKDWERNIAPVSAALSGLVLVFVLGTIQGYGDKITINREKKYKGTVSKRAK